MVKQKYKLLSVHHARGVRFVTLAMAKVFTNVGEEDSITQEMTNVMAAKDKEGTWSFSWLIHKNGRYEWFDFPILDTEDLREWCEAHSNE